MIIKQAYILVGDDRTGKTTFQKWLIWHLCEKDKFDRLYTNLVHDITHRDSPRKLKTLFTINRSVQEKMHEYKNIDNYFSVFFKDADICILSSHAHQPCINDIQQIIIHLNRRYYDVSCVFFSNHLNNNTDEISKLNWKERILINNPVNDENWNDRLKNGAEYLTNMIIKNANRY